MSHKKLASKIDSFLCLFRRNKYKYQNICGWRSLIAKDKEKRFKKNFLSFVKNLDEDNACDDFLVHFNLCQSLEAKAHTFLFIFFFRWIENDMHEISQSKLEEFVAHDYAINRERADRITWIWI